MSRADWKLNCEYAFCTLEKNTASKLIVYLLNWIRLKVAQKLSRHRSDEIESEVSCRTVNCCGLDVISWPQNMHLVQVYNPYNCSWMLYESIWYAKGLNVLTYSILFHFLYQIVILRTSLFLPCLCFCQKSNLLILCFLCVLSHSESFDIKIVPSCN